MMYTDKSSSLRALPLCVALLFCFSQDSISQNSATHAPAFIDLKEAIAQKWVSIQVTGNGGHQGEALKVVCKNLRGKYFRLRIPSGQLMEPADTAEQTLVVAQEALVSLTAKTPAEAMLKTFCTQAGDMSPVSGSRFAIGALAPEKVCKLLQYLVQENKIDAPEAQAAVWCLTSGHSLGSIGDGAITKFVADLLGKEAPGYRIRYSTQEIVPGQRAELGKALVIEGNFRYYLEKEERTIMVLLDDKGKQIKQVSKEEIMKAGEHRSSLRLEVYNLPAGKYTLRMQTKAGRVIKDTVVEF